VTAYVAQHKLSERTYPSLAALVKDVGDQVQKYARSASPGRGGTEIPERHVPDLGGIRFLMKDKENDLSKEEVGTLNPTEARWTAPPNSSRPG